MIESSPMDLHPLARTLIDIDSTTGREAEIGDFLFRYLEALVDGSGGAVERMPVEGDRCNVFAAWGEPVVVLSTHMDTVPPFFPSSEDGEHIHGRGACDTKGGIAAMLRAVEELLAEGRRGFGLLLVVGEETDSAGAKVANLHPRGSRYLVNGEPTENRLALGSKGMLYLALEAEGRAAHSAYPELGDNAIDKLLDALARLRSVPLPADPVLGETTLNVGTIAGGRAANVVADHARAEVMLRTVGETAELRRKTAAAVHAVPGVHIAEIRETPAIHLGALPGFETTIVKYTTDVPRLGAWGEPFLLGPGSIHVAHTPGERVAKRELEEAVRLYREIVCRLQDR
ncbi:MAG TPA: M20/M25/M40 family metallo-hydrolase [Thermoanaerobaculia bacterium]|jgi:acetylornithine deacetylase|nr:M20/M25/M40 family metallo-hydrolase [Thermoanaerobaculia bacterium]